MTHYQLQQALKTLRDQGYDVRVKLNAKTFLLQVEYDRLQKEVESVEVPAVETVAPIEAVEVIELPAVTEKLQAVTLPVPVAVFTPINHSEVGIALCNKLEVNITPRFIDLTGKTFGRLTIVKEHGRDKKQRVIWQCLCSCGNTSFVVTGSLNAGLTRSCGCYSAERATTHGYTRQGAERAEYSAWRSMIHRCTNPNSCSYKNYGGRGVTVHPTWIDSFEQFIIDVGDRPNKDYSLDRIDNSGNYEPGNVRWATRKEQNRNCRKTVYLKLMDRKLPMSEWSEILNISYSTLRRRKRLGWSDEKTLTTPNQKLAKKTLQIA